MLPTASPENELAEGTQRKSAEACLRGLLQRSWGLPYNSQYGENSSGRFRQTHSKRKPRSPRPEPRQAGSDPNALAKFLTARSSHGDRSRGAVTARSMILKDTQGVNSALGPVMRPNAALCWTAPCQYDESILRRWPLHSHFVYLAWFVK